MKRKILFFLISLLISFYSITQIQASDDKTAYITLAPDESAIKEICKEPIWKKNSIYFEQVIDQRSSSEIGIQTKKGKEPITILSNPELKEIFKTHLSNWLQECGLKLLQKQDTKQPILLIDILEFSAGSEKKILTGNTSAKSVIQINITNNGYHKSTTISSELEQKGLREKKIQKIQKMLNHLFTDTLQNIILSNELKLDYEKS